MILLLTALAFSLWGKDEFLAMVNGANDWILNHFDKAFSYTSFFMVLLCITIYFSPIGKVKIGGPEAKPTLNKYRWFSIVLCTTIAVGILFWGSAEPLYHLSSPPDSLPPGTDPIGFSMSTMYMHWSFTPYAIYTIPALLFALGYYNMKQRFSLGTMLFPIIRNKDRNWWSVPLDNICLFALVAGMSASLGAGILSISGGIQKLSGLSSGSLLTGAIALIIVLSFTISAATGLLKGIRILSSINVVIFILLVLAVIILGPASELPGYMLRGLKEYIINFIPHSLSTGNFSDKEWTHSWTTFYWANWMAWAPVSALFLGRIAYGYTVRQFIIFNWLIPALFAIVWMTVFSGTSIYQELNYGHLLGKSLHEQGPESVMYNIVHTFPFSRLFIIVFLFTMFISYVTAADSNTEAMSGISTEGLSPDNPDPPGYIKYIWGALVGVVAWVMVSFSGISGVKMLSNLGGLPALFLLILCCVGMTILIFRRKQIL
ncbi:MAG: BCCT family transporter [Chitinophagaceae bacterium]|nr:BCCT family transporter [Chitinophagaceae bacterium]MCB9045856.1 BCCT family transporter [Chitinophagales bacterium]